MEPNVNSILEPQHWDGMKVQAMTLENAPLSVRSYFSDSTGPLVGTLAQVPELLQRTMPFLEQLFGPSALSMRHKEMIILGVSVLQGCDYCTQTHTVLAHQEGVSVEELQVLRRQSDANVFLGKECLLWEYIRVVGAGVVDSSHVSIAVDRLKEEWLEFELVEITMLIGTTIMLNRYCITLNIPTAQSHVDWLVEQGMS
jgi:AhpD family alkylhydroperoxidase